MNNNKLKEYHFLNEIDKEIGKELKITVLDGKYYNDVIQTYNDMIGTDFKDDMVKKFIITCIKFEQLSMVHNNHPSFEIYKLFKNVITTFILKYSEYFKITDKTSIYFFYKQFNDIKNKYYFSELELEIETK